MKKQRYQATKTDWAKAIIYSLLYVAFLCWIGSWWGIIVLPFLFDAYVTRLIPWTWWKDLENPISRMVMSWIDAIVFALVAVYFVNIYFFQNYTIPSSSLEKSLLVGDYLFVSKTSYGPRVPQTPLHMPLCQHTLPFGGLKSYIEWPQWEYKRVTPRPIQLNDIVVFNYPAGDTVALNYQNSDYYLICNSLGRQIYEQNFGALPSLDSVSAMDSRKQYALYAQLGRDYVKSQSTQFGEVVSRPVDRRENYVKRCVGLPGQTLQIKDHIVYLDGKPNKEPDNVQYNYQIEWKQRLNADDPIIDEIGLSYDDIYGQGLDPMYAEPQTVLPLTEKGRKALLARQDLVASVTYLEQDETEVLYPLNKNTGWTCDNYGPIWIPKKGKSIQLTLDNLPIYERPIAVYEGNKLEVTPEGKILINGQEAHEYTFKMDYYWMQGDNRHNSADSRFWGFVPEDHVVGKPIIIWMSLNKDHSIFNGGIRWNRLFRWVDNIK